MKTTRLLIVPLTLCLTALTTHAKEPRGNPLENSAGRGNGPRKPAAEGLQLSSGLQTAASLSPRMSDEDWRKAFPQKDSAKNTELQR